MQINPFGFPLGGSTANGVVGTSAQPCFAAALGAFGDTPAGTPNLLAGGMLAGGQPNLAVNVAPAAMPAATDGIVLPGLQATATLSQLMATAARLPAADAGATPVLPAETEVPLRPTTAPSATSASATAPIATAPTLVTTPAASASAAESVAPAAPPVQPAATAPDQPASAASPERGPTVPAQPASAGRTASGEGAAAEAPVRATPEAATPGKSSRLAGAPEEKVEQPAPDAATQPAQLVAAALVQQPQPSPQAQPQRATRGEAAPSLGTPARKMAAAVGTQLDPKSGTVPVHTAADSAFERAVAVADNAGGQPQGGQQQSPEAQMPEIKSAVAAARPDAPAMPPHVQHAATPGPPPAAAVAEPLLPARAGQLGQSLGVEVARKVEAGEETLRVRLSPEHFGKVEITLAFDDGKLQATVRAESAQALDLLRQDAPDLARTLDQAGIRTDSQSFRFEARADGGNGQAGTQQQQQRGGGQHQQHARHDDLEPAPAYRAIRGDGQVDLLA